MCVAEDCGQDLKQDGRLEGNGRQAVAPAFCFCCQIVFSRAIALARKRGRGAEL